MFGTQWNRKVKQEATKGRILHIQSTECKCELQCRRDLECVQIHIKVFLLESVKLRRPRIMNRPAIILRGRESVQ